MMGRPRKEESFAPDTPALEVEDNDLPVCAQCKGKPNRKQTVLGYWVTYCPKCNRFEDLHFPRQVAADDSWIRGNKPV